MHSEIPWIGADPVQYKDIYKDNVDIFIQIRYIGTELMS